ncbi:hypothetical protein ACH5RR_014135 [Cinchona calisaya]|uniref:Uncharacterized protein n=1 Tax=Cinchona calisaya TaxID=153742 RepID=A0ABD3A2L5_9GENT
MNEYLISFLLILGHFASRLNGQQQYSGLSIFNCNNTDKTGPSPAFLYSCNGEKHSCQAFLIFRSQSVYNSATTISNLTSSSPAELARVNNIPVSEVLPQSKEVIVPVNCSCSGQYYQANTSYLIQSDYDTYYTIANTTYQGLATCDALEKENPYDALHIGPGMNLRVPLRCACPTKNQTRNGIKFLLTYLVTWDDSIHDLSRRFNVTARSIADANGFIGEDPELSPFTTILIPLPTEPLSSQTKVYSPPVTPYLSTPTQRHKESDKRTYTFVGIAIGSSLGVVSCILFLLFSGSIRGKILEASNRIKNGKNMKNLPANILDRIADFDQELKIYKFEELEEATGSFSARKKLSDSVYHGVLRGKLVAIKKMSKDVKKEVKILQKINHFNLISLYGLCQHDGVYYLAYEFMENGSLKEWLKQKSLPETQSWNTRIRIALDIANGLNYLHNFTAPAYVHKDINSGNILLNSNLRAKIANFSIARSSERTEHSNSSSSTFVLGTKGYVAPECLETSKVTPKVDVYAFGVVLLELITGRDAIFVEDGRDVLLSEAVVSVMAATKAEYAVGHLIDPCLQEKHPLGYIIDNSELALRLMKLGVACLAREPSQRPTMAELISRLMKIQLDVQNPEYSFSVD